ncbi:hypothetical protein F5887DRAFT_1072888 [Amanita rubescens]|nr:hypothetical protein F5887DRAFT_1072888 [Amanita rubescens]
MDAGWVSIFLRLDFDRLLTHGPPPSPSISSTTPKRGKLREGSTISTKSTKNDPVAMSNKKIPILLPSAPTSPTLELKVVQSKWSPKQAMATYDQLQTPPQPQTP